MQKLKITNHQVHVHIAPTPPPHNDELPPVTHMQLFILSWLCTQTSTGVGIWWRVWCALFYCIV